MEEEPILNECAICYESVHSHDILEPCKHYIHKKCFLLTQSNTCPLCRQIVYNPTPNIYLNYTYFTLEPNEPPLTCIQIWEIIIYICVFYIVIISMYYFSSKYTKL